MKRTIRTELTVSKIQEAALEEFGANGYAGGTINNICKRGINKGLIYHNFKDKDELYLVCLENSCKKLVSLIQESGCTSDQLQYMELRMRFFTEYPNEAHIFFEAILQPQEKLRDRIKQILEPFDEINEKIYRSASPASHCGTESRKRMLLIISARCNVCSMGISAALPTAI